jgi:pyruvate formate lyase activating enzyme
MTAIDQTWLMETFLPKRKKLIDGVTVSGGEPTLDKDLPHFCRSVKEMGLLVKLDTNGTNPRVVEDVIDKGLVDYVAVDIKTSPSKYPSMTQTDISFDLVKETVDILKSKDTEYELRTTCVPEYVTPEDLKEIGSVLGQVSAYYLQQFVSENEMIDDTLRRTQPYPVSVLHSYRDIVSGFADKVEIRGI